MSRLERLQDWAADAGRPARVALVGTGQMGRGLAAQVGRIPGMELAVTVDVDAERARGALALAGRDRIETDEARAATAVEDGVAVAITDAAVLSSLDVDVVVEATGVPEVGAQVAHRAILAGQHVVMLNVETDVTAGLYLEALARGAGVVYSIADGDEPVCGKELVDFAHEMAFEVVCAGKGKNNPFIPEADPSSCAEEAARKHMNPKMLASFQDGSKTMIEMAALANATGMPPDITGMHGPTGQVDDLRSILVPTDDGGLLSGSGRVDYAFGPAPGVFVIVTSDDAAVSEEMTYLSMGDGPYWALYRPYHLASIEAPRTVMSAVLDRRPALAPVGWTAEVVATAKRDLEPGTVLEGIGGIHMRGVTYRADAATELLPLGLAEGAVIERAIPAGEPIPRDAATIRPSVIANLRDLQDRMLRDASVGRS
ncbi:MAG: NAD(P)-dependent oxidoreductase [Nitriliruptoraceae bacterium]|nr:NAD(P)-dependent oxidoreductase [Nitriliruptoraceae bacterium]